MLIVLLEPKASLRSGCEQDAKEQPMGHRKVVLSCH
jgi:hypothetical protein